MGLGLPPPRPCAKKILFTTDHTFYGCSKSQSPIVMMDPVALMLVRCFGATRPWLGRWAVFGGSGGGAHRAGALMPASARRRGLRPLMGSVYFSGGTGSQQAVFTVVGLPPGGPFQPWICSLLGGTLCLAATLKTRVCPPLGLLQTLSPASSKKIANFSLLALCKIENEQKKKRPLISSF